MLFRSLKGELKELNVMDYLSDKEYYRAIIQHIFSKDITAASQNISNLLL